MKYHFEENQKFTQWWIWIVIFTITLILYYFIEEINHNNFIKYTPIIIPLTFYFSELRIKVNDKGLYYQFFPFHFKYNTIKAEEIKKVISKEYNPITEYGGWGIKKGVEGKAYNTSGKLGVVIYLKNGEKILFGSKKNKELEKVIKKIIQ